MRTWGLILGGLIVWAAHFVGTYALVSLADISADPGHPGWRVGLAVFGGLCLAALALLALWAWRDLTSRDQQDRFASRVALAGQAVAALGVVFQTLPAVFG